MKKFVGIQEMDARVWLAFATVAKLKGKEVCEYLREILIEIPEVQETLKQIPKD